LINDIILFVWHKVITSINIIDIFSRRIIQGFTYIPMLDT
jgi:hypothetical protein